MPFKSQAHLDSLEPSDYDRVLRTHSPLGTHPLSGDHLLLPIGDRYGCLYVLGLPGAGKSHLLANLITHDITQGQSVIVIDPHKDLIRQCIAQLPDEYLDKVFILDMEDIGCPFGINLLHISNPQDPLAQDRAVDRVMHAVEIVWPEVMSQQHLPRYLRAATIVLLHNPGATFVDMYWFLTDRSVRQRMLKQEKDTWLQQFWQNYDDLSPAEQRQQIAPLLGRLESLFMGRSVVRNILGQETTIDFRAAIEQGRVIFVNAPLKTLKQDAQLICTFLIAQIHAATFAYGDMPEQQRHGFSLYVDEFQHFATKDFQELLNESRKFGARVAISHQHRAQLPASLQHATLTARTVVCFHPTPDDARELAPLFMHGQKSVKPRDIEPNPLDHLLQHGVGNLHGQFFLDFYVRPLAMSRRYRRGGMIEIQERVMRWDHAPYHLLGVGKMAPKDKIRVDDPLPWLNDLLRLVMQSGDGELPIPPEVVRGFSNAGKGFYAAFRRRWDKAALLEGRVKYPPYLVIGVGDRERFTRLPDSSTEQLLHFLFHIRALMRYLAKHPIGTATAPSQSEIAVQLTSLPKRAAWVSSGDIRGVIYTDDTPPMMEPEALRERLLAIRAHTRAEYCRPIQAAPTPTPKPADVTPPPMWEDVDS